MRKKNFFIIGIILLIAAIIIAGIGVSQRDTRTETQAEAPTTPQNIRITQLSQTSFTIKWETEAELSGYIKYGIKPNELTAIGVDQKGTYKFKQHTIKIDNLEPGKTYYYKIISEKDTYTAGGKSFEIKTLE